ncbi:MAG TPA: HEAT repeat domain-containing protein [Bryobacteraceae bacterium]|jgi:hypothetical protein|nr:HEAT repeat domain-containing protein [Bryobacteraceae bacterium]
MTCDETRKRLSFFLYGELSFQEEEDTEAHLEQCAACRLEMERERALQRAFDASEMPVVPGMAAQARRELMAEIARRRDHPGFWQRWMDRSGLRWRFVSPALQPIGALALLLVGYFGARVHPWEANPGFAESSLVPVASRVRYVEPEASGKVRIVVEDARQRVLTGDPSDDKIRKLLMAATQDPADPGVRVESVNLLTSQSDSAEVRRTMLWVLQHDSNAGVRLKALESLKASAGEPETREVLSKVLLTDKNPGVRTQAIDLLTQHKGVQIVGILQELMRRDDNGYVRYRCERTLHEMDASEGTF